eukprot:TRINITY_DN3167_c0_g1_i5.p1 TRINITY_DN3167_c0_g1~~TRINITY_DN3167_c0_g1_i5.p1  ORF type:complete len:348 (+),score=45.34 TRINITY_DN3167_c0_g1_i5:314-1357(+)
MVAVYDLYPEEPSSGAPLFTINKQDGNRDAHTYAVTAVQWYAVDTGLFFTGSMDETVKVWDTNTASAVSSFSTHSKVNDIAAPTNPVSGHCLIAAGLQETAVRLADPRTNTSVQKLVGHRAAVLSVAWSPRSEWMLASGCHEGTILYWDVRRTQAPLGALDQFCTQSAASLVGALPARSSIPRGSRAPSAHNGPVFSLEFSPDGLSLFSYGGDNRIRSWDAYKSTNMLVNFRGTKNTARSAYGLALSHDGEVVYHLSADTVQVFDSKNGELRSSLKSHYGDVMSCCTNSITEELVTGGADCQILSWRPQVATEAMGSLKRSRSDASLHHDAWSDSDEDDRGQLLLPY